MFQAVVQHINFEVIQCLVIAGPGFAKDQFKKYLDQTAIAQNNRPLIENKDKIVVAAASSAYRQSIKVPQPTICNPVALYGLWVLTNVLTLPRLDDGNRNRMYAR